MQNCSPILIVRIVEIGNMHLINVRFSNCSLIIIISFIQRSVNSLFIIREKEVKYLFRSLEMLSYSIESVF